MVLCDYKFALICLQFPVLMQTRQQYVFKALPEKTFTKLLCILTPKDSILLSPLIKVYFFSRFFCPTGFRYSLILAGRPCSLGFFCTALSTFFIPSSPQKVSAVSYSRREIPVSLWREVHFQSRCLLKGLMYVCEEYI